MRALLTRGRLWLMLTATGGGLLVLEGCDPSVRDQVLGGVSTAATGLATTFIQAFFQALINKGQDSTATTVQAILDYLPRFFA